MFAQMGKVVVTEGNAEQVVKRFGGKGILGKPKPDYIVSSEGGLYEVEAVKKAVESVE